MKVKMDIRKQLYKLAVKYKRETGSKLDTVHFGWSENEEDVLDVYLTMRIETRAFAEKKKVEKKVEKNKRFSKKLAARLGTLKR